jgi:hypothetical protein
MLIPAKINAIYRYPAKGLSPEPLAGTLLTPGQTVPSDRLYAIENGPSDFDPQLPHHQPKTRYLMLMRNERLAMLRTRFDDASHVLTIESDGRIAARGDLRTSAGRHGIDRFCTVLRRELADRRRSCTRQASFSDVARKVVSIINLAGSPRGGDRCAGQCCAAAMYVEAGRRRFDRLGREIAVGEGAGRSKRIVRAARSVDPATGARDLAVPEYAASECRLRRIRRGDRGGRDLGRK